MSAEQCQMILNVRGRQRGINIGRLIKIIALCDNYDGIQTILDHVFAYENEHVSNIQTHIEFHYFIIIIDIIDI